MIEVIDLKKCFGSVKAIDGVSFSAQDGKITGLLGPNGAGKSTTLRILYTAFKPDSGKALIDNRDVTVDKLAVRTSIGVLTHGAGGKELTLRVDELAELLDMNDFIGRRAKGFSQGQKTKVALARALVHKPRNVLLDEPTNGLDIMATRGLREVIQRLKDAGHCVLFSSHVMQEVAALCDEIVIIANGTVAASGSPDSLRQETNEANLEDAFVKAIGSEEGLI